MDLECAHSEPASSIVHARNIQVITVGVQSLLQERKTRFCRFELLTVTGEGVVVVPCTYAVFVEPLPRKLRPRINAPVRCDVAMSNDIDRIDIRVTRKDVPAKRDDKLELFLGIVEECSILLFGQWFPDIGGAWKSG